MPSGIDSLPDAIFVSELAVELTFELSNLLAIGRHSVILANRLFHDLVDHELGVALNFEASDTQFDGDPQSFMSNSYSTALFEAGKCKRIAYCISTPRGETKMRPTPAPLRISDPSKYMTQYS